MKNLILVSIAMSLVAACQNTEQAQIAPPMPIVDESKAISLFNGKDLTGWKVLGTEKWYVEDGLLVCKNGPDNTFGYLYTTENYKNFQLTLEYKQEKSGNSGIFIRAEKADKKINGWQVEIAPPGHSTGGINKSQVGWLFEPDSDKDDVIKMGEWNTMKVVVTGNTMTSWLNGTHMATINDVELSKREGGIALQLHGENDTHIRWRNINVIAL